MGQGVYVWVSKQYGYSNNARRMILTHDSLRKTIQPLEERVPFEFSIQDT